MATTKPSRRSLLGAGCLLLGAGFLCALAASQVLPAGLQLPQRRRLEGLSLVNSVVGSDDCKASPTAYDTTIFVGVYFALVLYTFLGLAIVCDEYFCESLEQISAALRLSDDVAGATFMAAGSSAPELFTAIITIFISPGGQGVGTIVGSAVFNICVIVGITSLCAGQVLQLWWYPLMRDSSVYAASILLMLWAMRVRPGETKGQVTTTESSVLVGGYVFYVLMMVFNGRIVDFLTARERRRAQERHEDLTPNPFKRFVGLNPTMQPAFRATHNNDKTAVRRKVQREQVQTMLLTAITVNRVKTKLVSRLASRQALPKDHLELEDEIEAESQHSLADRVIGVVSWPMAKAMALTIPDCREDNCQQWYPLTFSMSIMWIGLLSFLMVDFASRAGCILGVSDFMMGLTILAAGTSVPDALSSILVARNGQGNMAVCNVLGSNVFNILLGLGLPWLIYTKMHNKPIEMDDQSILEPMVILFSYLIAFILILMCFSWRLTPGIGWLLLFMQLCYWTYNVGKDYCTRSGECPIFNNSTIVG